MKKILKNIGLAAFLAIAGCENEQAPQIESNIPKPANNQSILFCPDYLNGISPVHYKLLTDYDDDGHWDILTEEYAGRTTGSHTTTIYYKKGYGPAQSLAERIKLEFVEPEFFKPYE